MDPCTIFQGNRVEKLGVSVGDILAAVNSVECQSLEEFESEMRKVLRECATRKDLSHDHKPLVGITLYSKICNYKRGARIGPWK
jgi:hypothetical protein